MPADVEQGATADRSAPTVVSAIVAVYRLLPWSLRRKLWGVRSWVYHRSERYVWHVRDLAHTKEGRSLPPGVELVTATRSDIPALAAIGMPMLERFWEFSAHGGELCVAMGESGPIAAIWLFRGRMPLYPWLELPDGVCALEHAITATEHRGRGLMPAVMDVVAKRLSDEGFRSVTVKVLDTNGSSLRMMAKADFTPVALMHRVRVLGRRGTRVEPARGFGYYLARRLSGVEPWEGGDDHG